MTTLNVTVKESARNGQKGFTGTVTVPGLKATQVARTKDGESFFQTVGALKSVANSFAKRLGVEVTYSEPAKKAAKKSVKSRTASPVAKKATKSPVAKKATKSTKAKSAKVSADTSSAS